MGRRRSEQTQVGEDSFLDTIANLVGIMIILVVIVGARSYTTAREVVEKRLDEQEQEIKAPLETAQRLHQDISRQEAELQKFEMELAYRSQERILILDQVTIAKQMVEDHVETLSDEERKSYEIDREFSDLEKQLADLLRDQGELPEDQVPPKILQHLPTPMAKTVFGHEIHVMLLNNKVSVIPWNELVETLKREARGAAERNTRKDRFSNTLGPIGGFTMKYTLKSQTGIMSDGTRTGLGRLVELDRFFLQPEQDLLKESIDEALSPNGRLRAELSTHQNHYTTVTVWVYPDSFPTFRDLKERLFPEGFLCAARPLPFGVPIGASPNGSASSAQ